MDPFIGRKRERKILEEVFRSSVQELIAVYGRRRVGKTFMVEQFFSNLCLFFEISAHKEAGVREQLLDLSRIFSKVYRKGEYVKPPKSWNDAFALLQEEIEKIASPEKIILFFNRRTVANIKEIKFMFDLESY